LLLCIFPDGASSILDANQRSTRTGLLNIAACRHVIFTDCHSRADGGADGLIHRWYKAIAAFQKEIERLVV
jgi:hypothetical protein